MGGTSFLCKKCNERLLRVCVRGTYQKKEIEHRIENVYYCPNCDEFKEIIFTIKKKVIQEEIK